ncbi:hypothetical protein BH11ARM2_BH11ARM2_31290 [soil metagenome]
MKRLGLLAFALVATAGAQTPLAPLWTRPAFNNIEDVDVNTTASRTLVLTPQTLTVFPKGSSVPLWHIRTAGETSAEFSGDGTMVLLSGRGLRPRLFDTATGAFLRYLTSSVSIKGASVFAPGYSSVLIEAIGFYRVSDGRVFPSAFGYTYPLLDDQSTFSPNGLYVTSGAQIFDPNPNSAWGTATGNVFLAPTADSGSFVTANPANDAALVRKLGAQITTTATIPFPAGFHGDQIRRLGNSTRFVILGYESFNGANYTATIVIDLANSNVVDHRRTTVLHDAVGGAYVPHAIATAGETGYTFGSNALDPMDRDRLLEEALDGAGHSSAPVVLVENPRSQDLLAGGVSDAGLLATGSQHFASTIALLNGDTGLLSKLISRVPVSDGDPNPPFFFTPSGRFLDFNALNGVDSVVRLTAANTAGAIWNESDAITTKTLFPTSDESPLGTVTSSLVGGDTVDAKMGRSMGSFIVARTFFSELGNGTVIGSSEDGHSFLITDGTNLILVDGVSGRQLASTLWTSGAIDSDKIQTALDGEGYIVAVRQSVDVPSNRILLEIRRFARQSANLVPIGTLVRKSYVWKQTVGSSQLQYGLHFRLSTDGRAVWVNYQRNGASAASTWQGEWIRTADGGVMGFYNDPNFDWGVNATALDPLYRRGYLSRQDGEIQGVPLPNAFASIVSSTFEVVGGNPGSATFRLLRPADSAASYTIAASGVTFAASTADFPVGTRDVTLGFTPAPVATATDATVSVTDVFGTVSTKIHVVPPHLTGAVLSASSIQGGSTVDLDVTIDGPAPAGGRSVTLVATKAFLMAPATIVVPQGATTAHITIPSGTVKKDTPIVLTARLDTTKIKMPITLTP